MRLRLAIVSRRGSRSCSGRCSGRGDTRVVALVDFGICTAKITGRVGGRAVVVDVIAVAVVWIGRRSQVVCVGTVLRGLGL